MLIARLRQQPIRAILGAPRRYNSSSTGNNMPGASEPSSFKFPVWKSLGFTALCGAGLFYFFSLEKGQRPNANSSREPFGVVGTPKLGGPLRLTDQNGLPFDSSALNKFMLVYFGFTRCPDICPEELDKMGAIMEALEGMERKGAVIPVFVTVDPERDGPTQIKEYLKDFHPSFVGLTGSAEEVKAAARKYRVYYRPAQTGGASPTASRDYLVDHSIFFFLIDPEGRYVAHFGREAPPKKCADVILDALNSWDS